MVNDHIFPEKSLTKTYADVKCKTISLKKLSKKFCFELKKIEINVWCFKSIKLSIPLPVYYYYLEVVEYIDEDDKQINVKKTT